MLLINCYLKRGKRNRDQDRDLLKLFVFEHFKSFTHRMQVSNLTIRLH